MNPLRAAFDTLVAGHDRLAAAIAALSPLLGVDPPLETAPAELVVASTAKALKPGRTPKRTAKKGKAAKKVKSAKGKGSRPRITPETIARIQAMDGQGKTVKEIVAACRVSAPTVTKYANAAPVKLNGGKPEPVAVGRTDPRTGRPWV